MRCCRCYTCLKAHPERVIKFPPSLSARGGENEAKHEKEFANEEQKGLDTESIRWWAQKSQSMLKKWKIFR